jgi:predicted transcriptional regulator
MPTSAIGTTDPSKIIRELTFAAMVERGLADSIAGRTISHEEMRRTLESWRK